MAAKGHSNDLAIDAVQEVVLSDRDDFWSQDSERTDEEESVYWESEEDVVSETFSGFDSLNLRIILTLELFKKCVRRQVEVSCIVFLSYIDLLNILSNASANCMTVVYDEAKLRLGKTRFRLGGKVSIRRTYQCKKIRNFLNDFLGFFVLSQLQDVVHNISLAEKNKCHSQGWKLSCYINLCVVRNAEGTVTSYFRRRVSNGS